MLAGERSLPGRSSRSSYVRPLLALRSSSPSAPRAGPALARRRRHARTCGGARRRRRREARRAGPQPPPRWLDHDARRHAHPRQPCRRDRSSPCRPAARRRARRAPRCGPHARDDRRTARALRDPSPLRLPRSRGVLAARPGRDPAPAPPSSARIALSHHHDHVPRAARRRPGRARRRPAPRPLAGGRSPPPRAGPQPVHRPLRRTPASARPTACSAAYRPLEPAPPAVVLRVPRRAREVLTHGTGHPPRFSHEDRRQKAITEIVASSSTSRSSRRPSTTSPRTSSPSRSSTR